MVLNFQDKLTIVSEVNEVAKNALSAVIATFSGVTVDRINELRKVCRESGVYIRVVRNTLMRRIVKDTNFECLKDMFIGPTIIAFSNKHPGIAARLFKEFTKDNINFNIKVAAFEGKVISALQIDRLATLPSYEEAIVLLMLVVKEASIGKLVRTLTMLL